MKKTTKTVSAYMADAPKESKAKLAQLRKIIKTTCPQAVEKISYGMPSYQYHGQLAYFSFFKNHIGLYVPPPVIANHKKELAGYVTAKATVRFPLDEKLPVKLIQKLIKARMKINKEKKK